MIQLLTPVDSDWLYQYILEPLENGPIRIEQAYKGKVIPAFIDIPLSLKERVVYLIQGVLLMIPLVNSVIWVVMKIFGAQKLNDPYHFEKPSSLQSQLKNSSAQQNHPFEAVCGPDSSPTHQELGSSVEQGQLELPLQTASKSSILPGVEAQQNRPFEAVCGPDSSPTYQELGSSVKQGQLKLSSQTASKSSILPDMGVFQLALESAYKRCNRVRGSH